MAKISSEKTTVELMINLYCRKKHDQKSLCIECKALKNYAMKRLEKCPFGDEKPACNVFSWNLQFPELRQSPPKPLGSNRPVFYF